MNIGHIGPRVQDVGEWLLIEGESIDTGHWQSLKGTPHSKSIELTNVVFQYEIPPDSEQMARELAPNLPWAEDHFQERVAGEPTNPGEQYMNWPWYDKNWEAQGGDLQEFSHTYQERFWPRHAGDFYEPSVDEDGVEYAARTDAHGIRYRYGDLNDVVSLLAREPHTRQAYLPIWFPEDTGAHAEERVPCTLGYHFLLRQGRLHINYFIRSCDFLRYFRDDVYMAARLCQWMIQKLRWRIDSEEDSHWEDVQPGTLTMFISSLHVFEGDLPKMRREYGEH